MIRFFVDWFIVFWLIVLFIDWMLILLTTWLLYYWLIVQINDWLLSWLINWSFLWMIDRSINQLLLISVIKTATTNLELKITLILLSPSIWIDTSKEHLAMFPTASTKEYVTVVNPCSKHVPVGWVTVLVMGGEESLAVGSIHETAKHSVFGVINSMISVGQLLISGGVSSVKIKQMGTEFFIKYQNR